MGHKFKVFSAEGIALAGSEVSERHFVNASNFGVKVMNSACESVRSKPIPDDLEHGAYNSPLLVVPTPVNWRGPKAEALEIARKIFKEKFGQTDTES